MKTALLGGTVGIMRYLSFFPAIEKAFIPELAIANSGNVL